MGIDLDNFPTSPSARRMISRITPIYGRSYVGKWIFEVMGAEVDFTEQKFAELRLQALPETATWGLKYWEQRYGIYPDESVPIEQRRRRIMPYRMPRLPMNPVRMERILSEAIGREVKIKENIAPYTFGITIDGNSSIQVDIAGLFDHIQEIKPAHQSYSVTFVKNTRIYAGANLYAKYKPAAIIDGYSVSREAQQAVNTGAGQYTKYIPTAVIDGYSVSRCTRQVIATGADQHTGNYKPAAIVDGYKTDREVKQTICTGMAIIQAGSQSVIWTDRQIK